MGIPGSLKIKKNEFYDIYALSLFYNKLTPSCKKVAADILNDIAKKYLNATKHAVCKELRHAIWGGYDGAYALRELKGHVHANRIKEHNLKILEKIGIAKTTLKTAKLRGRLSFDQASNIFSKCKWLTEYGGKAWAKISKKAGQLDRALPVNTTNANRILVIIDQLNQLEHNCALYLQDYASFYLISALDDKFSNSPKVILRFSSKFIRDLCKMADK